jgi:recombination protein RecT
MSQATAPKPAADIAPAKQLSVVETVNRQVAALVDRNSIHFPKDYDVANALAHAKLALANVQSREGKNVVDANGRPTGVCTEASMVNAVFDMCVQGMNIGKKQGYFIVYGNQLAWQRSYFGDEALAIRVKPGIVPYGDVIYEGETFVPKKVMTKHGLITVVEKHELLWPRDLSKPIVGAYKGAVFTNPGTGELEDLGIELMGIEQIRKSWEKSKTIGPKSFHNEQPDQACNRTVTRRWSKPIINTSNDVLLLESVRRQDETATLAELDEEEMSEANGKVIDLEEAKAQLPPRTQLESEPAAANEASPEEIVAALGLNEDQLTFVKDQLGAGTADFLKGCHADGLKSWKEVNNRIKSDLDTDAKKQEGFSQF